VPVLFDGNFWCFFSVEGKSIVFLVDAPPVDPNMPELKELVREKTKHALDRLSCDAAELTLYKASLSQSPA
jgi:hypothetical protein